MGPAVTPIQIVKVPWTGGRDEVIILKCLMEKIGKICIFCFPLLLLVIPNGFFWYITVTWPGRNSMPPGIGENERKEMVKNLQIFHIYICSVMSSLRYRVCHNISIFTHISWSSALLLLYALFCALCDHPGKGILLDHAGQEFLLLIMERIFDGKFWGFFMVTPMMITIAMAVLC